MTKYALRMPNGDINLSDDISSSLRESILDGSLSPGLHLVEEEIARQLGVSRIPVREAIDVLRQEGLIIKEPYKGAYVHPYTETELTETTSVRVAMEQLAVEFALKHWTQKAESDIAAIVDQMDSAWHKEDNDEMFSLDNEFHRRLWQIAQHDVLFEVLSSLRARISRFLHESTAIMSRESGDQPAEDHRDLLRALSSGDVKFAQAEMVRHLMIGHDRVRRHYRLLRESSLVRLNESKSRNDGAQAAGS